MPQIHLPHCFVTNKTRDVLYKELRGGVDRGKTVTVSWMNIHCEWCKKFVSRKRLAHKTNNGLILCKKCAAKHHKDYQKEYMKNYVESYSEEKKLSEKIRKREYMRKKYDFKTKRI